MIPQSMILWGLMDSPFVRRVAVALHHHGCAYQRRPLSVFRDFEAMRSANPLGQAPVLTLASGTGLTLFESTLARREKGRARPRGGARTNERLDLSGKTPPSSRALSGCKRALPGGGRARPGWSPGETGERGFCPCRTGSSAVLTDSRAILEWLDATHPATSLTPQGEAMLGARPALTRHSAWCEAQPAFAAAPYLTAEALATGGHPNPEEERP